MKRRQFLRNSALSATWLVPGHAWNSGQQNIVLQNPSLAWRFEKCPNGICAVAFENRLSGRRYRLETADEFALVFSQGQRLEIPWWNFQLTDAADVPPEHESGLAHGFEKVPAPPGTWTPVNNLAGVQKERIYPGYGWFRHEFALPENARGKDLIFVLGGYDEQDWLRHWIYVNGNGIGERTVSARWHSPGRYVLGPTDSAYAALQFGAGSRNLLAIRAHGYDLRTGELSGDVLEQYVFRPFLFDQFISIGEPNRRISRFELRKSIQESPEGLACSLKTPLVVSWLRLTMSWTASFEGNGWKSTTRAQSHVSCSM